MGRRRSTKSARREVAEKTDGRVFLIGEFTRVEDKYLAALNASTIGRPDFTILPEGEDVQNANPRKGKARSDHFY